MTKSVWRMLTGIALVLALLVASGALYEQLATMQDMHRYPAPGTLINIGDRQLHLLCTGTGAPTIMLIPSGLGTVLQYARIQDTLADSFRVCSIDRAGLGWSDQSSLPASATNMESDFEAVIAKAVIPPPYVLVASSAGGLTADLFVRKHPEQVKGIVWVDALTADMVTKLPELHRLEKSACTAWVASWFGIPRLMDPLNLRSANTSDAARSAALTYRRHSLGAACSLTKNFVLSAKEIQAAPLRPATINAVILMHAKPTGLYPYATPDELASFDKTWILQQRELAESFSEHSLEIAANSGHLIAADRPDAVVNAVRTITSQK